MQQPTHELAFSLLQVEFAPPISTVLPRRAWRSLPSSRPTLHTVPNWELEWLKIVRTAVASASLQAGTQCAVPGQCQPKAGTPVPSARPVPHNGWHSGAQCRPVPAQNEGFVLKWGLMLSEEWRASLYQHVVTPKELPSTIKRRFGVIWERKGGHLVDLLPASSAPFQPVPPNLLHSSVQ